jgi:hypothetical protein
MLAGDALVMGGGVEAGELAGGVSPPQAAITIVERASIAWRAFIFFSFVRAA